MPSPRLPTDEVTPLTHKTPSRRRKQTMQTSKLLLAAGCLLLASLPSPSRAAEIPGIVSTAGEGLQPSVDAESVETFSCLAVIYPYSTWQPNTNSSAKLPTPSPPPSFIEGSIDFSLVNLGTNPIEAPWTLGVYNPLYTQVLQVIFGPSTRVESCSAVVGKSAGHHNIRTDGWLGICCQELACSFESVDCDQIHSRF